MLTGKQFIASVILGLLFAIVQIIANEYHPSMDDLRNIAFIGGGIGGFITGYVWKG